MYLYNYRRTQKLNKQFIFESKETLIKDPGLYNWVNESFYTSQRKTVEVHIELKKLTVKENFFFNFQLFL